MNEPLARLGALLAQEFGNTGINLLCVSRAVKLEPAPPVAGTEVVRVKMSAVFRGYEDRGPCTVWRDFTADLLEHADPEALAHELVNDATTRLWQMRQTKPSNS